MRSWHGDCWNNAPEASGFSGPSMAIPVNKADERDESKRNRLLSPGGQKGFLRSRRKWMNPIPEKFANVLVSRWLPIRYPDYFWLLVLAFGLCERSSLLPDRFKCSGIPVIRP
jgi:hypothetical protein